MLLDGASLYLCKETKQTKQVNITTLATIGLLQALGTRRPSTTIKREVPQVIPSGCTRYEIGGIPVIALNEKSARRKVERIKAEKYNSWGLTESRVELEDGTSFNVYHNLPEEIEAAVINWSVRTSKHTADSLCGYINSKRINGMGEYFAFTEEEVKHLKL